MNTSPTTDDPIRDLMRRAVAETPATPSFDTALARAAGLGVTADEAYVTAPGERATRRSIRGLLAGLLALVAMGGGGYFAYATFIGPDGYDTPTEAAEGFVDALSSGDLLRAGRALVPFEREHMDVRLRNVLRLATDGGSLKPNDLSDAKHVGLQPEGLKWRERPMVAGITRVEAVAGHLWLDYEPGLFVERLGAEEKGRVDLVELLRPADEDRLLPASLVVLNRDGDW